MIGLFLIAFLAPAIISVIATPWIIRCATYVGAVDIPNERKIHRHPVPRLGGFAVYLGFSFAMMILFRLNPALASVAPLQALMVLGSIASIMLIGILDDVYTLNAGKKFIVQIFAASLLYFAGIRISSVTNPLVPGSLSLGVLDFPVTVLWIVGVTNAFNLIDGIDGLASGVGFIASLTIAMIALMNGNIVVVVVALVLAGALAGFLRYNSHPARIFLGDSGSLFVGFTLAAISVQGSMKGLTAFALFVPVLVLGLPIIDTLVSMIRRFLRSVHPHSIRTGTLFQKLHTMFLPDGQHIHHRLIAKGLNQQKVVFILYAVSGLFGLSAITIQAVSNTAAAAILIGIAVATVAGIHRLHYKEMAILQNGMLLPIYEVPAMNSSIFRGVLDIFFIAVALSGAYFLTLGNDMTDSIDRQFYGTLIVVTIVQVTVFVFYGLHKETLRHFGIGDIIRVGRTVVIAAIMTGLIVNLIPVLPAHVTFAMLVLDFYLLLTLVIGSRMSFHVLNYMSHRERNGKRVLLYGAGPKGIMTLQSILSDERHQLVPVGFLDDNPALEGKHLDGYKIFGSHWPLQGLLKKESIDEVLICDDNIKPEILNRIQYVVEHAGVELKRSTILLEDFFPDSQERIPALRGQVYDTRQPGAEVHVSPSESY